MSHESPASSGSLAATFAEYRRSEFSAATAAGISLNHAGISPSPARVVHAVTETIRGLSGAPLDFYVRSLLPMMISARKRLARMMGVSEEHLAFTKNTGHGLAIIADGLVLEPGDNIVTASCEYPAVVYPWYAQKWRGVETRIVPMRPDGTVTVEDFAAQMDERTRVVAISWVQFGNGFRADLAAFARLAHDQDAILVADVIQGLGAQPCAVEEWGVDVAATGAHKWLMAPAGTGGLYVAPHVMERMNLVNIAAGSVIDMMRFDPLVFHPKPTAQRFEEGSTNGIGLAGLEAALSLLEEAGVDRIADRIASLSGYAIDLLERKGYRIATPRDADGRPHSGLVTFTHPAHSNETILEALTQAGVAAAVRGGNARLSPHFYNIEDDIAAAVAALPAGGMGNG